ncbi:uncharacterized protein [Clytia hemisphaerica]|uniref:uncharacterized protein n=1 Tax=Clytia hemisphaerica TaxID=252671 RepID=UPI0034D5EA1E
MATKNGSVSVRKGANKHCCWGNCKSDSRYPDKLPPGTFFINFPQVGKVKEKNTQWKNNQEKEKTEKAKRWAHKCGRKGFDHTKITKDTYICSLHFHGGKGPTEDNPEPILATLSSTEVEKCSRKKRKAPTQREHYQQNPRTLSEIVCSNIDTGNDDKTAENSADINNNTNNDYYNDGAQSAFHDQPETSESASHDQPETSADIVSNTRTLISCNQADKETQTEPNKLALSAKIEILVLKNEIKLLKEGIRESSSMSNRNPMSMDYIMQFEAKTQYFIGLSRRHFWDLYDFLGDAKFNLTYWNSTNKTNSTSRNFSFSPAEQLFITLLRLRRGFNLYTVAHFYFVSEYTIRTIFTTWIMFMFHHFKSLKDLIFPERQAFKKTLPKVFKPFKNICASIDCTEFKCEVPRDYKQQGNMYSKYKSNCTMKCLIAVNPNGAACFVSDLFEGSINDVEIFQRCGFLQHVNFQDSFLVDKGFTVQHLLLPKQATIYIPPFLGQREKFTKEEVLLCKRIAKARIHVERFNERLKRFRLLDRVIPLTLAPMASQLVYVGSMLVNFQEFLCK